MSRSLFVTGATGLIGRHLLKHADLRSFERIYCLTRSSFPRTGPDSLNERYVEIIGDLTKPGSYAHVLTGCESVLHLAAATGKQPPSRYDEINVNGTRDLVAQCERAHVTNFLHLSSIVARSVRDRRYRYAESKRLAEEVLQASGLRYTIIRPTIVLAQESPIWLALSRLACLPRPVIFGDGDARIQPIYIGDLVACIDDILEGSMFHRETYELGGPDIVTFGAFLESIHELLKGRRDEILTIPMNPILSVVSILEGRFSKLLPLTSGQLIAFISDGTIEDNRVFQQHVERMHSIPSTLQLLITRGRQAHAA
jgi:NADH dehydrogenase